MVTDLKKLPSDGFYTKIILEIEKDEILDLFYKNVPTYFKRVKNDKK